MSDFRSVVVPYDFSEHSEAAVAVAIDLGKRLGSSLHLVHVVQHPMYAFGAGITPGATIGATAPPPIEFARIQGAASDSLESVGKKIATQTDMNVYTRTVVGGSIVDHLVTVAEELEADLIVMGTHGRTGLAHVFLGSVAERTLRRAPCPVVAVRAEEDAESRAQGA